MFLEEQTDLFAEYIVHHAYSFRATDIHFIPKRENSTVNFRVDGKLIHFKTIPTYICNRIISHFKYLALMDIGEKRKPQSGALTFQVKEIELQLRISTLPSVHDETLVIRIHPQEKYPELSKLTLFKSLLPQIHSVLHHTHGLYLISGPTGCGKTTTLYSLLNDPILQNKNIITLEDPVERQFEQFIQVQVNELAGITFENGLKSILRHDPDIILIGEIRDLQTAKIAVQAALTGHLVFGTVHANDTMQTIDRLIDLGITSFELQQVLGGVLTQRLVSIVCPFCKGECHLYCPNRRRLAVFEVLQGVNLQKKFLNTPDELEHFKTISDYIKKGYALGYIPKSYFKGMK